MDANQRALARFLLEHGMIHFGKFVLECQIGTGKTTPIFLDFRDVSRQYGLKQYLAKAMVRYVRSRRLKFEALADIPLAISLLVGSIGDGLKTSVVSVREQRKVHGQGRLTLGPRRSKGRLLGVDDVITNGTAKLRAIDNLRSEGYGITDMVIFVERTGEGGRQALWKKRVRLHAILDLRETCRYYLRTRRITRKQYDRAAEYFHWAD